MTFSVPELYFCRQTGTKTGIFVPVSFLYCIFAYMRKEDIIALIHREVKPALGCT